MFEGYYGAKSGFVLLAVLLAAALSVTTACSVPRLRRSLIADGVGQVMVVAGDLPVAELPRLPVASGLHNPRGILASDDGTLLLAEAGSGKLDDGDSARLLRLADNNADGDFDDDGERAVVIDGLASRNILNIVQRDEVFGMAAVARGAGITLASHALFSGPSVVFKIDEGEVSQWATVHGNLNHLLYDEGRRRWFAVSSSSDELLRLSASGRGERVVKFSALGEGQDAVPGYLRLDPTSGNLLVSLFSGSPLGESGGDGTELVSGAGSIVSVNPDTGAVGPVITGLTAPTDFIADRRGRLYVLELCDAFVDGVSTREDLRSRVGHGGFRRFSGRLLRIDLQRGLAEVIASGLDTPTNLTRLGNRLLISEGMGTPGRAIPRGGRVVELDGFVESLELPAS